jgi:hypothetical protein
VHTAERLLARGWGDAPAALAAACRYRPELVEELAAAKATAVILTWSAGLSHEAEQPQREAVKRLLPLLRKKKIRALARISAGAAFPEELCKRVPQAAEWAALLDQPAVAPTDASRRDAETQRGMDLRHAGWRAYVREKATAAIEAGFDGLHLDAIGSETGGAAEFVAALRVELRAGRAAEAADVVVSASEAFSPFLNEAGNFKLAALPGRPAVIPAAAAPNGPLNSAIGAMKLLFESGGRDKCFAAAMAWSDWTEKERALAAAAIFACGGTLAGPWIEDDVLARYAAFHAEHADLFGPADPVGTVGVLVDDVTSGAECGLTPYEAEIAALVRASVQFDVIPVSQIERFDLRRYRALNAAHLGGAAAVLAGALSAYVNEHGGTVVSSGVSPSPGPLAPGEGGSPLVIQAPEGVTAFLWGKGTKRWVHVLNHRSSPSDATIELPGCGGRQVTVHSPDARPPALQVVETGQARVAFVVSGVESYAVAAVV